MRLLGFDLALFPSIGSNLRAGVELSFAYGSQQLQDVDGPLAELELLWLSAGAALHFASPPEPQLLLGPLLRLAYVHVLTSLERDGFVASDAAGYVIELGLAAWLRVELGASWDGYVGCELGYVPSGATFKTETTRAISVDDVLLGLRVGVGRRF